jgi:hypothetical protein
MIASLICYNETLQIVPGKHFSGAKFAPEVDFRDQLGRNFLLEFSDKTDQ